MVRGRIQRIVLRLKGELTFGGAETTKALVKRGLKIGDDCKGISEIEIDSSHCWHIEIGDNVTFAPGVRILAHDASMKKHLGYTRIGKVKIGDNAFIGSGAIILPHVTIGSNTIIGAGSLVSKNIPDNVVAAGNPAKALSSLEDFVRKHREQMEQVPSFSAEYTVNEGITAKMKDKMNQRMIDGQGYVV